MARLGSQDSLGPHSAPSPTVQFVANRLWGRACEGVLDASLSFPDIMLL